jgi:hypothetical protein
MPFKSVSVIAALCGAFVVAAAGAPAGAATINLGQSTQDFSLLGLGTTGTPGFGYYAIYQGAETDTATLSTFTLSGTISGSTNPGFASGDYRLVTTMAPGEFILGTDASAYSNSFVYDGFYADTDMTLYLTHTPTGNHTISIMTNGVFDGPGIGFGFTSTTCTGVSSCSQYEVGQTLGATISGPVDISINLGAPEPATWALTILGVAMIGFAARRRNEALAAAA